MMTAETREAVRERLELLATRNGGRLTPEDVVEDAKDAASPLHAHFEWDEAKAAAAYWLDQARTLIRSVRVELVTETRKVSVVAYVRDPAAGEGEQGYVSTARLRTDADQAREALIGEFSRVSDMLRRAREIAVALDAAEDVDRLLEQVVGLRARFMTQPAQQQ